MTENPADSTNGQEPDPPEESGDAETPGDPWAEVTDSVRDAVSAATEGFQSVIERASEFARQRGEPTGTTETAPAADAGETPETTESVEAAEPAEASGDAEPSPITEPAGLTGSGETVATVRPQYTDAREVLDAVAAGVLPPEEAAGLLGRLGGPSAAEAGVETRAETRGGPPEAAGREPVVRLRVRAIGRRVRLIGEPFVNTVAVDGPHVIRQDGDTMVVTSEGEFGASLDGFTLTPPRSLRDVQQKVADIGRELAIRVNPALLVDAEVTAGSINAERLPKLEQVRVTAGSVRLRDVEGPLDLLVQAGSAQVEGKIWQGRSRLRVESGSMQVRLLRGSDVVIRPDVQLGRVGWDPARSESDEYVIGSGLARLDLEVVMGQATIKEAP